MYRLSLFPELSDRQYLLVMRRLSNRMATGGNASIFLGSGLVFLQSRVYLPGDPVRSIDWRVMARTGRPHVKQYETQTHTPVYVVVDNSASMTFSAREFSKYGVAALLAGGMAYTGLSGGNPVSIMASDGAATPPTFSANVLTQHLRRLRYYSPTNRVRLDAALARLSKSLTCRSFVVVLSDLHDECAALRMRSLALRHECIAVQLTDPVETQPLKSGFIRLRAAECDASGLVSSREPPETAANRGEGLQLAGIPVLRVDPERPFDSQIRAFLRNNASQPWRETTGQSI